MIDGGPPENGPGRLEPHHSASGLVNQRKRNSNKPRITDSENVSSRVRELRFKHAILRGLEGPLGEVLWSMVLEKVINDPPPYWFVTLLNLTTADQVFLRENFGPDRGGSHNYTCRFVSFERAITHFEAVIRLPKWAAEIDERQKVYLKRGKRLRALQSIERMRSLSKEVQKSAFEKAGNNPGSHDETLPKLGPRGNRP